MAPVVIPPIPDPPENVRGLVLDVPEFNSEIRFAAGGVKPSDPQVAHMFRRIERTIELWVERYGDREITLSWRWTP